MHNHEYYVIYLQNKKFMQLIFWPEGAYTGDTYTTSLNHESLLYRLILAMPNGPKSQQDVYNKLTRSNRDNANEAVREGISHGLFLPMG